MLHGLPFAARRESRLPSAMMNGGSRPGKWQKPSIVAMHTTMVSSVQYHNLLLTFVDWRGIPAAFDPFAVQCRPR